VVTLRVKDATGNTAEETQKRLIDDLSRVVGEELIVFGQPAEGVEPHLDVTYTRDSAKVTVRTSPTRSA
jgi:hypothetical protein